MASIDKQASWIARASLAVAPIVPAPSRELTRNQNQLLSRLQIMKPMPRWHLHLYWPSLTDSYLVDSFTALKIERHHTVGLRSSNGSGDTSKFETDW
jgi:hypothetical protein